MRRPRPAARRRAWRTTWAAALLAPAALLAACSSGGSSTGTATASTSSTSGAPSASTSPSPVPTVTSLAGVTVTDPGAAATSAASASPSSSAAATGAAPVVTTKPFAVTTTTTRVLTQGTGQAIAAGDLVTADFVGVDAATGTRFGATSWAGAPTSFLLGPGVIPGFTDALKGVKDGTELLAAVPPDRAYGPAGGLSQAGIGATDTILYLLQVRGVAPGHATGTPVAEPAGLPTVAVDPTTHVPTVTIPAGVQPPSQLVSQTLVKGAGAPVAKGQTLTVMYTGVLYRNGQVFDASWTRGESFDFQLGAGQVIPGWDTGLAGQTVGSQVLLVVPPAQGYGSAGQESAGITGTDTLVFVVDVLKAA